MKYTTKYSENQLASVLGSKKHKYHLRDSSELDKDIANQFDDNNYISDTGITKRDILDEIESVNVCSRHVAYISVGELNKETGEVVPVAGAVLESNACNNSILCPLCAANKRNEVIQSISVKIKTMEKMKGLHYYLLTLTLPTCSIDNVRKNYDLLRDAWTSFVKMGQRRGGKRSSGEMGKTIGYILGIEAVKSNADLYHVHGHCFLVTTEPIDYSTYDQDKRAVLRAKYGNNIPKDELLPISKHLIKFTDSEGSIVDVPLSALSLQWYEATKGAAVDIHCTPIDRKYFDILSGEMKDKPLITSCYEVVKYATKAWEVPKNDLVRMWVELRGTRRITKGGIFSGSRWYKKIWGDLVEKNECTHFHLELAKSYVSSTLDEERSKYRAYLESIDRLECGIDSKYHESDSTYLTEKYSDLQRKRIYDVVKGLVVSNYLKHKNDIVEKIPVIGRAGSVVRKNSLTDLMRGLMRGVSNCLFCEIKLEPIKGINAERVKRFVDTLRGELFFGYVLRASRSFNSVSSQIYDILASYK